MLRSLRANENFHIVLWLLKDLFWVMEYRIAGLLLVPPAVIMAMRIVWISRARPVDMVHALAVVCWISANSIWMIGEFFFGDSLRNYSISFFVLGLLMVSYSYAVLQPMRRRKARRRALAMQPRPAAVPAEEVA